jgi:hypothetical protein
LELPNTHLTSADTQQIHVVMKIHQHMLIDLFLALDIGVHGVLDQTATFLPMDLTNLLMLMLLKILMVSTCFSHKMVVKNAILLQTTLFLLKSFVMKL